MGLELLPAVAVVALVLAAVYTDLRHGKVYNFMTVPAMALGIALHTARHGATGAGFAFAGIALALLVWALSGMLGGRLGGGDVKLLAAVGALCGARFLMAAFVVAALAGGVLAVLIALRRKELRSTLARSALCIACRLGVCRAVPPPDDPACARVPYALPIALGVVGCLLAAPMGRGW